MMRIILLISIFTFFYACNNEKVNYLPQVVYFKNPELNKDTNKLLIEFAVSDIESRTGNIKITIDDKEYNLKNRYFSSTGTVITKYVDKIPNGEFSVKFEVNVNNDKTITEFKNLEVNENNNSEKFDIENIFLSKNKENILEKTSNAVLRFPNIKEPLVAKEGQVLLKDIEKNRYDFDIEGVKKDSDGFYRYIFLESIVLNKKTKLYFNIVFDENEYYDKAILSCDYSSKNNAIFFVISIFFFMIIRFLSKNKSNNY